MGYLERKGIESFRKADVISNGSRPWDIQIHNKKFFSRLLKEGTIALGESYVDGWWDCKQIDQFVYRLLRSGIINQLHLSFIDKVKQARSTFFNIHSMKKSKKDVAFHYNIRNDLFECMLDKYMNYSCGYWKNAKTLDQAQKNKMELICKKLKLKKGMNVLDIGCGWGGLARYMADKYNVNVTGITLSQSQYAHAQKYNKTKRTHFLLQDYREHKGTYDRIVSVGMFEHVGYKNHKKFMKMVNRCLMHDGLFLLHFIAKSVSEKRNDPWIDTYMFPGTIAVSAKQVTSASEGIFYIQDWHNFGPDYYKTIKAWYTNIEKNWPELSKNYDEKFHRTWAWYLLCCSATSLARTHHLWQIVFSKVSSERIYERVT
ncbi:cyclopropane fatty acyl phospholipid synthase [Candidatus Woesearchaeota archaeon]|nr:cyclopropane fatty acyl phospholipid synthase [Candidatus Woesearchaeota archaeon]